MIQIFCILPLQQNSVNMQAIPIIDTCALSYSCSNTELKMNYRITPNSSDYTQVTGLCFRVEFSLSQTLLL